MEGLHPNTSFQPESSSFWRQLSTEEQKNRKTEEKKKEGCEKQLQIYLAGC